MSEIKSEVRRDFHEKLSSLINTNRFPHALLIECDDDALGAQAARLGAQMLICENPSEAPCGKCAACKKTENASHPDISEYSGGNSPRSFKVDWVREAIRNAYILPNEADVKVFVFLRVQTMSESAQNAVLKVLEEPPSYVRFILQCDSKTNMLETILSRCVLLSLKSSQTSQLSEKAREGVINLAEAVNARDEYTLLKALGAFEKDKDTLREVISELIKVFRDAAFIKGGGKASMSSVPEAAKKAAESMTMQSALGVIETLQETEKAMGRNINYNLLLTALCAKLRRSAGR